MLHGKSLFKSTKCFKLSSLCFPHLHFLWKLEINFLHASLADYLLTRRRSGQYYIGWQEAHTNVAIYLFDHYVMAENSGMHLQISSDCSHIFWLVGLQAAASFANHLPKAALTDSLQNRMRRLRDPRTVSRPIHGCIGAEGRVAIWETLQLLVDETVRVSVLWSLASSMFDICCLIFIDDSFIV